MNSRALREPDFFLTRQLANLMEDLLRQLKTPGAACVLYGKKGTGKTALLRYFCQHRLQSGEFIWITLNSDRQSFSLQNGGQHELSELDPDILQKVKSGSTLFIDGVEHANNNLLALILRFAAQQATRRTASGNGEQQREACG